MNNDRDSVGSTRAKTIATIKPLDDAEKKAMLKIMDHLYRNGATVSLQARARCMVMCAEFAVIYRPSGIQDMAAFIDWAFAHDIDADEVLQTIMHDLQERHEPFMAPRTHGYSKIDSQGD